MKEDRDLEAKAVIETHAYLFIKEFKHFLSENL